MSLGDFTSSVLSCVGDASYSKKTFFVAHLQRVTHAAPSAVFLQKARSTLATMSKQHCRSNRQLCCLLLRHCCWCGPGLRLSHFMSLLILKRSEWHVLTRGHTGYLPPTRLSTNGKNHTTFDDLIPSRSASPHFGRYSFPVQQRRKLSCMPGRRRSPIPIPSD